MRHSTWDSVSAPIKHISVVCSLSGHKPYQLTLVPYQLTLVPYQLTLVPYQLTLTYSY